MPNGYHDKLQRGKWHDGPARYGTIGMRATRFRQQTGLLSWTKREGSEAKNVNILKILPQDCKDANSTKSFRDLTRDEIKTVENIGSMPSRGSKVNRAKRSKIQTPQSKRKNKKSGRLTQKRGHDTDDDDDDDSESSDFTSDDDASTGEGSIISGTESAHGNDSENDAEGTTAPTRTPTPKPRRKAIAKSQAVRRQRIQSYDGPMSLSPRDSITPESEASEDEEGGYMCEDIKDIERTEDVIWGPQMSVSQQPNTDYRFAPLNDSLGATNADFSSVQAAIDLTMEDWYEHIGSYPTRSRYVKESYSQQQRALQDEFANLAWPKTGKPGPRPQLYWLGSAWVGGWQGWKIPDERGRELRKRVAEREGKDRPRKRAKL